MGLKRVQAKKRLMNTSQGNARSIFPLALLPHVYIIRSAEKRKEKGESALLLSVPLVGWFSLSPNRTESGFVLRMKREATAIHLCSSDGSAALAALPVTAAKSGATIARDSRR